MDPVTSTRRERISIDNPKGNSNKMWMIILTILVLAIIGAAAYFMFMRGNTGGSASELTPTEAPTDIPEPTEEEVDLSAYEVQVLNGSGVAGEAGRVQESLEAAGFTIAGTGNADNSDYTETIIQAKADVSEAFLDELESQLSGSYPMGASEELEEDSEYDVVVIIGGAEDSEDEEATDEASTDTEDEEDETPTPTPEE